jgi:hypothetical protein
MFKKDVLYKSKKTGSLYKLPRDINAGATVAIVILDYDKINKTYCKAVSKTRHIYLSVLVKANTPLEKRQ